MRLIEFRALNGTDFNNLVTNAADMLLYNPFVCTTESAYVGAALYNYKKVSVAVSTYDTQNSFASYSGNANTGLAAPTVASQDDRQENVIQPVRVADAQAGYWVVGVATAATVRQEFTNYTIISNTADANVLYVGQLKVSKTDVYTPAFLSTTNVQFQYK
jgi:hypothetical protein